jgi:hypothetical protein
VTLCAEQADACGLLQVVPSHYSSWRLTGDAFHLTILVTRLSLLLVLLLPLPYINIIAVWQRFHAACSSSSKSSNDGMTAPCGTGVVSLICWYYPRQYWQHPGIRQWMAIFQRLMTGVGALGSVMGVMRSSYLQPALHIMYWQGLWKYAVQGWLAVMFMVGLPSTVSKLPAGRP